MATIEELKAKRAALDAKIEQASKAAKLKKLRAENTAKAHLKNVLGGWCLAFLADPTNDQSFKQLMLSMTDESVTKQPEHLARIRFDEFKKAAGV
jgi:hypothetical protein